MLAPVLGGGLIENGKRVPFRTVSAVSRGEAALVRTDPVVGALVPPPQRRPRLPDRRPRPARRCGVIRTKAVTTRTTLLLVRYRFHLTLPSRAGERQLVAEDARLLAFEGAPSDAAWLAAEDAARLLHATADENTDPTFGERTMKRLLDALPDATEHLDQYGDGLAAELRDSHRRVRSAAEIIRGVDVKAQKPADVLGAYVYLPVTGAVSGGGA